jgi:DNA polymerase-1
MPTRFPIFIIDASSYLSRVYYHPQPKILDKNIENITVYNFCRMLRKLASRFNFAHIVIVWDGRKEIKPSIGFLAQKKLAMEFVDLIKMEQIMQQNIAAYDTIFSMVTSFNHQHHDVIIVTDNKNFFSLVNDATTIFDPFAKVITQAIINREFLEKKYKFPLEKFPFFLALAGDTTGHISGVYGIGEKRAGLYIQRFNNLDDLYKNLNKIIDLKIQAALIEGKQNAYDSFEQATPHHHQNPTTVARTTFHEKNWQLALPFFEKHHYNKLISDIKIMSPTQESIIENISATHKPSFDLVIVTTKEQLITMTRHIKKSGIFSINAQGSQLDPMASMPLSISIAIDEKSVYYIPLHDEHYKDLISQQDLVASLKNVLLDAGIEKIINRAQYSLVILSQLGLTTNGPIFDITNAASFTMHDFDDGGLAKIINIYTHQANLSYQNNSKQLEAKNAPIAINQKTWYGIADVHLSRILKKPLEFQLINEQVLTNFQTIEMPITTILADMEITGICCNRTILERLDVKLADDIMKITQEIHRYCPTPININSTLQVRALLFETLKLPVRKKLSKTRSYSTDSSVLKELSPLHPIPGLILKYRELHKYQRPYIANLLQCINNKTHKIHPIWEQALGKTSRITATHPNIQSVPTKDLGYGIYIRSAFHAQENNTFIAADYNDIELRFTRQNIKRSSC